MTCNQYRDLISGLVDGELDSGDEAAASAHLDGCAGCTAYFDQASALRRSLRLHAAEELARIPAPVAVAEAGSLTLVSLLRWMLFVVGATLVILNASHLLFDTDAVDPHLGRHDGVFGTALGVGMLSVAYRPRRAIGLVPLASAITLLMTIVAISDLASSQATMLAETIHVLEFVGLVCLFVISGGVGRMQTRAASVLRRSPRPTVRRWPIV